MGDTESCINHVHTAPGHLVWSAGHQHRLVCPCADETCPVPLDCDDAALQCGRLCTATGIEVAATVQSMRCVACSGPVDWPVIVIINIIIIAFAIAFAFIQRTGMCSQSCKLTSAVLSRTK
jgi:hypothetical protein